MATTATPTLKVILLGDFGVGKTSIFRRFATDTFTTDSSRKSTIGLDTFTKNYGPVKLNLYDTGGMERVASITSSYYKYTEAAILVYSVENCNSFHSLSQHLIEVLSYAESCRVFLCGNKVDLLGEVGEAEVGEFCEQCSIHSKYLISCKTGEGVREMFEDIAETLLVQNRARLELRALDEEGVRLEDGGRGEGNGGGSSCC